MEIHLVRNFTKIVRYLGVSKYFINVSGVDFKIVNFKLKLLSFCVLRKHSKLCVNGFETKHFNCCVGKMEKLLRGPAELYSYVNNLRCAQFARDFSPAIFTFSCVHFRILIVSRRMVSFAATIIRNMCAKYFCPKALLDHGDKIDKKTF